MDDFFTLASFGTLIGCVSSTVVVMNVVRHAFNWGPRWMGLIVALGIAVVALQVTSDMGQSQTVDMGAIRYLIAFLNGCLIYTSAFGVQNNVIAPLTDGGVTLLATDGNSKPTQRITAWTRW